MKKHMPYYRATSTASGCLDWQLRSLSTNICRIVNSCIYKDLVPLHELGYNPYVYPLSDKHLQAVVWCPDYLKYGMLCMILSHRINQIRSTIPPRAMMEKFYLYWGLAVRSLNEYLDMEDKRSGDSVIAGILTLLLADVSYYYPYVIQVTALTHSIFCDRSNRDHLSIGDAI